MTLTVSQQGSRSGFTLVSLLILEGRCDRNKDRHASHPMTGYWCYENTWHFHTVLLCIFKALGRDELFTMGLIWGKWENMMLWKKWETQEGVGEFVTGCFCKSNECAASVTCFPWWAKSPQFDGSGRQEPRRSFLLDLCVLKYALDVFLTSWSWKTLVFPGQKLPSGFCVCSISVCEALAYVGVSKHETRVPLAVRLLVLVRTAVQRDGTNFAHFTPKEEETEWGITLSPSEECSKGYFFGWGCKYLLKREQAPPGVSCGPPVGREARMETA